MFVFLKYNKLFQSFIRYKANYDRLIFSLADNPRLKFAIVFIIYLLLAFSTLWHTMHVENWPANHDLNHNFKRVFIIARHLLQLDFLPVWSALDNLGAGSPQPLLYHKIFNLTAALLYCITSSYKVSFALTIAIYLIIGGFGMKKLCRYAGCNEFMSFCGGAMLIVANYTITNWLIRGAFAELVAAMFVPWFFVEFLRSLTKTRITKGLAFYSSLLVLSHSLIAYYGLLIAGTFGLCYAFYYRNLLKYLNPKNLFAPLAIALLVAGPYLFSMAVIGGDYDLSRLAEQYLPENEIQPINRYFWDKEWVWGRTFYGFTVQIDIIPMVLLVIGVLGLCMGLEKKFSGTAKENLGYLTERGCQILTFFSVTLILILFLQLPVALTVFYEIIPGASYIQFPWRLLALLTPALIALSLFLVTFPYATARRKTITTFFSNILTFCATLIMISYCGAYAGVEWESVKSISPEEQISFSYSKEFVPVSDTTNEPQHIANPNCNVFRHPGEAEMLDVHFTIECSAPSQVVLPIYCSPAHSVEIAGKIQRWQKNRDFPSMCSLSLPEGKTDLLVHMPTMSRLLKNIWMNYKPDN